MVDPQMAYLDADHLDETLARLDDLIARTENVERLRSGLGMRLALSMARELRDGKPLGADTAALVAGWVETHGQDSVDFAVAIAREFLTRPDTLVKDFAGRLRDMQVAERAEPGASSEDETDEPPLKSNDL